MSLFGVGNKKNKKENSVESQEQKTTEEILEEEKEDMTDYDELFKKGNE